MKKLAEVVNGEAYKHQIEGILYILNHHYSINGDDMGLGKSYQSIAAALITESKRIIVVCPAYLKYNWTNEFTKFSKRKLNIRQFTSSTTTDHINGEWDVLIMPYSQLHKGPANYAFKHADFIIGDEIQYVKTMGSRRSKSFHKNLKETSSERFVGLSGTVIENRVIEWFSPLVLCSYTKKPTNGYAVDYFFKNQFHFNTTFSLCTSFKMKGKIIRKWHGLKNAPMLEKIKKGKYLRRLTEEAIDLPDLIRKDISLRINHGQKQLKEAWTKHNIGSEETHLSTRKSESARLKAEYTHEYVKGLLDDGVGPIIIFTDHLNSAITLRVALEKKFNGRTINGNTSIEKRQEYVDEFQSGALDFMVLTIGAGSTGITLTNARHLVFNDLSWVPAQNAQAEKRIHRIGQKHKCVIHRIMGSVEDEMITKALTEKMLVLKEAL